jgi:uncharacterized protein YcfJ
MRFVKLAVLAALAIMLRPAGAAGQEGVPAGIALSAPIDQRLLVSEAQQRATLVGARQRVPLRADGWNLYEAVDYMAWGMLAGGVVGLVVGGATARKDLTGPAGIIMGGIMGIGVGGGAGVALYTVQKL